MIQSPPVREQSLWILRILLDEASLQFVEADRSIGVRHHRRSCVLLSRSPNREDQKPTKCELSE